MTLRGLMRAARQTLLVLALITIAALWLFDMVFQSVVAHSFYMDDAWSYLAAGQHVLTGAPIYAPFQMAGPYGLIDAAWGRGFVYPPTAALIFAPLGPFGLPGIIAFFTLAWLALGVLAARVARQTGLSDRAAVCVALLVFASGPAINAATSGNVNLLVADFLLGSWLWSGSSGYLAVIGGLIKVYPGAGLIWTLRRRRSVKGPIALGIGVTVLSLTLLGIGTWHDFVLTVVNGRSASWWFLPSPEQALGPGIGTVAGFGLSLLALVGVWRLRNDRLAFALLGWAMILPAPDWWSHYLVVPLATALPWVCARLLQSGMARADAATLPSQHLLTGEYSHARGVEGGEGGVGVLEAEDDRRLAAAGRRTEVVHVLDTDSGRLQRRQNPG